MRVSSASAIGRLVSLKERSNTWGRVDKITSFQIERKEGWELSLMTLKGERAKSGRGSAR